MLLKKFAVSTAWDGLERVARGINVIVGLIFVRYVGPSDFGEFSYVAAIYAMLAVTTNTGVDLVLTRDFSRSGTDVRRHELFTAGLTLKLAAFALVWLIGVASIALSHPNLVPLAMLLGLTVLSGVWPYMHGVFRAALNLRGVSLALAGNTMFFAALQCIAMLLGESILILALLLGLKEFSAFLILGRALKRAQTVHIAGFSWADIVYYLMETWPILLSGVFCVVYSRISQLLLMQMASPEALGIYAAGSRIVEYWGIIPSVLLGSLLPVLSHVTTDNARFERVARIAFRLITVVIVPVCIITSAHADAIVTLLIGQKFEGTGAVLAVLIWSSIFVFWGAINSSLLIVRGRQRLDIVFTVATLAVSLILNLALIPVFHEQGAAIATTVSFATGFILGFAFDITRPWSTEMLRSLPLPAACGIFAWWVAGMLPIGWFGQVLAIGICFSVLYSAYASMRRLDEWGMMVRIFHGMRVGEAVGVR